MTNLEFSKSGDKWISSPYQMTGDAVGLKIKFEKYTRTKLVVYRSADGNDFVNAYDAIHTGEVIDDTVSGGVNGLWLKFEVDKEPTSIIVL